MIESIEKYFPSLTKVQIDRFSQLMEIYEYWNARINLISRKDFANFYIHHVLHSLSIARIIQFREKTKILDVGTGGGFPGIPLAIMFTDSDFFLLDSIEKKTKAVADVAERLGLKNVTVIRKRAEEEKDKYDFVVSRAVMKLNAFIAIVRKNIRSESRNEIRNGIIYLKGGDVEKEISHINNNFNILEIKKFFEEPYFETKKIIYIEI